MPAPNQMSFVVTIFLILLLECNSLTFLSKTDSFAEYPAWSTKFSGNLEFEFQTFNPSSLLLYTEEISDSPNDRKSFLRLSLRRGSLYLVVQMGDEDFLSKKDKEFGAHMNDLKWHKVLIIRDKNKTTVTLDNRWSFVLINEGKLRYLPVNSSLFVGGISKEALTSLVNGQLKLIPR